MMILYVIDRYNSHYREGVKKTGKKLTAWVDPPLPPPRSGQGVVIFSK